MVQSSLVQLKPIRLSLVQLLLVVTGSTALVEIALAHLTWSWKQAPTPNPAELNLI